MARTPHVHVADGSDAKAIAHMIAKEVHEYLREVLKERWSMTDENWKMDPWPTFSIGNLHRCEIWTPRGRTEPKKCPLCPKKSMNSEHQWYSHILGNYHRKKTKPDSPQNDANNHPTTWTRNDDWKTNGQGNESAWTRNDDWKTNGQGNESAWTRNDGWNTNGQGNESAWTCNDDWKTHARGNESAWTCNYGWNTNGHGNECSWTPCNDWEIDTRPLGDITGYQ